MSRTTVPSTPPASSPKALAGVLALAGLIGCATANAADRPAPAGAAKPVLLAQAGGPHTSTPFKGIKANTGTVVHSTAADGRQSLTASADFVIPNAPAPHWQVVDSAGNVYLLQQLKIKDDKTNRSITLPAYVKDVAKVQIWCSYVEVLLGEASFSPPVR